jgi:hypothetical protein
MEDEVSNMQGGLPATRWSPTAGPELPAACLRRVDDKVDSYSWTWLQGLRRVDNKVVSYSWT